MVYKAPLRHILTNLVRGKWDTTFLECEEPERMDESLEHR